MAIRRLSAAAGAEAEPKMGTAVPAAVYRPSMVRPIVVFPIRTGIPVVMAEMVVIPGVKILGAVMRPATIGCGVSELGTVMGRTALMVSLTISMTTGTAPSVRPSGASG